MPTTLITGANQGLGKETARLLVTAGHTVWLGARDEADVKDRLDHEPDIYVSPATIWEVAIKQSLGKLPEPPNLPKEIQRSGFRELPITGEHAVIAGRLPPIHCDPFDRLLIAQAKCEDFTLVTRDSVIHKYDVPILAV